MTVTQNAHHHQEVFREEYCLLIRFMEIRYLQNNSRDPLAHEFNIVVDEYEELLKKIAKIIHTVEADSKLSGMIQTNMAPQLIPNPAPPMKGGFIKELEDAIEQNLADPEFNVEVLSRKLHMNRVTLYRKVRAATGETPTEFIRSYRLQRGAELLRNNFGSILDIALEVGFSSATYFTKCFKEKFHELPSKIKMAETDE